MPQPSDTVMRIQVYDVIILGHVVVEENVMVLEHPVMERVVIYLFILIN